MSYAPNFYFDSCCASLRLIIIQQLVQRLGALHAGLWGVAPTLQGTVILKGLKVYQHSHVK